MKITPMLRFAALALLSSANAQAATATCSISALPAPTAFSGTYSITLGLQQALSLTVSCTKTSGGPLTGIFTLAPSNGLNPSGSQNRAGTSPNLINYDIYTNTSCSTLLTNATQFTMVLAKANNQTTTQVFSYAGCVPVQTPLPVAGTQADTVNITLSSSTAGVTIGGTNPSPFSVNVTTTAVCSISTIPNITLAYGNAFSSTAVTAITSAPVMCSNQLPYTMTVSPTSGVSAGIYYSLSLPASGTGTGLSQGIAITATAPAGQAGTCAAATCTGAAQPHTLTVTY